ncbi:MAG: EAL domain-containing protein [Nitrosomonadales bacterium]|nr:EAL domain-containing protein [Nitrosomonadales bacterium]
MSDQTSFNLLSFLTDFAVRLDAHGVILQASELSRTFLKYPASLTGEQISVFIQPEDMAAFLEAKEMAALIGEKQPFVCRLLRQHALHVWVDCHIYRLQGQDEYVFIAFDASHWKASEAKLAMLSTHDPLTQLPGRLLLDDRIRMGINNAVREKQGLALMLLDMDGFKKVNETLGHQAGDKLIKAIAQRMQGVIRRNDTLARIGGDEFALIMSVTGDDRKKGVEIIAKKLLAMAQRPFQIDGNDLYISVSIGIAIYLEHGDDPAALLRHAEIAMYNAKEQGRNRWELYDPRFDASKKGNLSLEAAMHEGIQNGEFLLHYQPVFCMQTGVLKGAEALMRWDRPGYGLVSPGKFIPLAESSGMIEILGSWALRMACHQAKLWQEAGVLDFYVSVNVSPSQFRKPGFADLVKNALDESGLAHSSLMLEITEGVLMNNPEKSNAILSGLRDAGVKIAIDDFGTGYSSLSYLKKFPLSVLKIDKSFVDDVPKCAEDVAIVSAVLNLAAGLGLKVVAEGVEVEGQLEFLKAKGCDLVQGFLTGKPMNAATFREKCIPCLP